MCQITQIIFFYKKLEYFIVSFINFLHRSYIHDIVIFIKLIHNLWFYRMECCQVSHIQENTLWLFQQVSLLIICVQLENCQQQQQEKYLQHLVSNFLDLLLCETAVLIKLYFYSESVVKEKNWYHYLSIITFILTIYTAFMVMLLLCSKNQMYFS